MLSGPDVSESQGDVDWKKVAKKHELAIVRVSDGDHRDPFYGKGRTKAVREAGLLFAPYYFARVASPLNGQRDGAKEAAMVLGFAKEGGWSWPGDLPLMYDFETDNGQPADKCARHVVEFVRAYHASEGHFPGIYTMPGFWERILPHLGAGGQKLLARCFLWQAEWGVDRPRTLAPWKGATLWQWTATGRATGVSGGVDLNRSLVPEAQVRALAGKGKAPAKAAASAKKAKAKEAANVATTADGTPEGVPPWLPKEHWAKWQRPWQPSAANSSAFQELLMSHGYLSPHFTRKESHCNDPANTPVPASLRANAQRQAFYLERLRHELGDKPLPILSWYRTKAWNAHVGGAGESQHLSADASDFTVQTVESFGASRFDAACEKVYAKGGFGRYASGSRHGDSRGTRARW
jgi:GH25 family lysozyme M1 (1,4-beta-N-acetylmuramidase)